MKIKLNQKVKLKVAAYMENEYEGVVKFIDPKFDSLTRTVQVKADVENT
jgi:membrane fusion protein (multidrug efflux system)